MTFRNYYHIYQILEEYSKQYISFEYTPKFTLDSSYQLSKEDIDIILKNNGLLIKAFYKNDEKTINDILKDSQLPILGNYEYAQLGEEDAIALNKDPILMQKGLPLPVQARYVLVAWNALRTGDKEMISHLSNKLNKKAFKGSLYTAITLLAMSFDSDDFNKIATNAYYTLTRDDTFSLYYKLLAYYFRLNDKKELKTLCNSLSKNYTKGIQPNDDDVNLILRSLKH